jgi:hypothetical protein
MPPWEKYGTASPSPWQRYGEAPARPDAEVLADVSAAYRTPQGRLEAGGTPEAQSFGQYAGNFLKKAAIPTVTTAAGGLLGGLPGAMAGSGIGETANQALRIGERDSVITEVNQPNWNPTAIGVATAAPAVVQGAVTGAQKVAGALSRTLSPKAMSEQFLKARLGPDADDVARALAKPSPIANYPQTAAEKLVGSEFGGVVQGHQQAVAKTPGGISSEFGKIKKFGETVLGEAAKNRDKITAPMRDAALTAANGQFGLKPNDLVKVLRQELKSPEVQGAPASKKALESISKTLSGLTDEYGRVDARSLYQFKKEGLDQVVNAAMEKEGPKISEAFRAKELIKVKKAIDEVLDKASGGLWKPYLSEYSGRSKIIDAMTEAREAMYKPVQAADLRGGVDIAPSAAHQVLPPWLSRPVTTTKWLAEKYASKIEPKIDRRMADLYQHPGQLLATIQGFKQPSRYQAIIDAMIQGGRPAAAGVAAQHD